MKSTLIIIITSLSLWNISIAQSDFDTINWEELVSFKIFTEYSKDKPIQKLSESEIDKLSSTNKEIGLSKKIFKKSTATRQNTAMFSGIQFGLATFSNGTKRLFKISSLGFQDQTDGQYYDYNNDKAKSEWKAFIKE